MKPATPGYRKVCRLQHKLAEGRDSNPRWDPVGGALGAATFRISGTRKVAMTKAIMMDNRRDRREVSLASVAAPGS
jgi:hypothetical protein